MPMKFQANWVNRKHVYCIFTRLDTNALPDLLKIKFGLTYGLKPGLIILNPLKHHMRCHKGELIKKFWIFESKEE